MSEEATNGNETTTQTDTDQHDNTNTDTGANDSGDKKLYAGKFEDVDTLENSYLEAQKEIGRLKREKPSAPPEKYELDFSEDPDFAAHADIVSKIDIANDQIAQAILPVFKEKGLSQDDARDIFKAYLKAELSALPDPKEIKASLGKDGEKMIAEFNAFNSKFPPEKQHFLASLADSKEGVEFLHQLVNMVGEKKIPPRGDTNDTATDNGEALWEKAQKLRRETPNFDSNTKAIEEYERLTSEAINIGFKK